MSGRLDPSFIDALLFGSGRSDSFHILVSDSRTREHERIQVVPEMLKAHSHNFCSVLNVNLRQLNTQNDIMLRGTRPHVFKNMLRFLYGHDITHTLPISELLQQLQLSIDMEMEYFKAAVVRSLLAKVTPATICEALQDPICLKNSTLEPHFKKILKDCINTLIDCPKLSLVCPESMRYIIRLNIAPNKVWNTIIKWVQYKVQVPDAFYVSYLPLPLKSLIQPDFVQPCSGLTRKCSMDMTNLVEEVLSKEISAVEAKKLKNELLKYHTVGKQYPTTIFVCTESRSKYHIEHQEFSIKIVYNCSHWSTPIFREGSHLIVFTSDRSIHLYSVACQSLKHFPDSAPSDLKSTQEYTCQCSVIVALDVQGVEEIKYEATINQTVMFSCEFEIRLQKDGRKVILKPNQKYWVKIRFSDAHPLFTANEIANKAQDKRDLTVQCSEVVGVNRGSHIKHLLYRNL